MRAIESFFTCKVKSAGKREPPVDVVQRQRSRHSRLSAFVSSWPATASKDEAHQTRGRISPQPQEHKQKQQSKTSL
jgi:hypothetical protein